MKKNYKLIIKGLLVFIISAHVFAYVFRVMDYIEDRPYKLAKAHLAAVDLINVYYAVPLQKVFGYRNIIAMPFIKTRDFLYNQGIKHIPETDGEREIWWNRTYSHEYNEIISVLENRMIVNKTYRGSLKPDFILDKQDELYSHIYPLATLPIKDKKWEKLRLSNLYGLATIYTLDRWIAISHLNFKDSPNEDFYLYDNGFFNNEREVNKIEKILDIYLETRGKYPKNYFSKESLSEWYLDDYVKNKLSLYVLARKILTNEFKCSDKEVKIYTESYNQLLKAYNDPNITEKFKDYPINFTLTYELAERIKKHLNTNCN